jgi:hypothetical protein
VYVCVDLVMQPIMHPLFGGGVSCQFIWFVALLIVLTAGSGVLAYLILGSDLIKPDLICMLACVSSIFFLLSFLVLICCCQVPMPLSWAGRLCKQLSTVWQAQAAELRLTAVT